MLEADSSAEQSRVSEKAEEAARAIDFGALGSPLKDLRGAKAEDAQSASEGKGEVKPEFNRSLSGFGHLGALSLPNAVLER